MAIRSEIDIEYKFENSPVYKTLVEKPFIGLDVTLTNDSFIFFNRDLKSKPVLYKLLFNGLLEIHWNMELAGNPVDLKI